MPKTRSKMGQVSRDRHAEVSWCAIDIQEFRPDWTLQQCNEFLVDNEDEIRGQMIMRGWDVLAELLRLEER
jgi:hypothetical protein